MKRWQVLGCLGSLAAGVLAYALWVSYPPALHQRQTRQLIERYDRVSASARRQALDARQNAFLDPQLLPFWGRTDHEYRENNAIRPVLAAVTRWSTVCEGNEQPLDPADPQVRRDFAAFARLYPHLRQLLQKPVFLPPQLQSGSRPNLANCRKLGEALLAYSEYLQRSGRSEEALEVLQNAYRLSRLMVSKPCTLVGLVLAIGMQKTAQLGTLQLVNDLNPDQLRRLGACLAANQLHQVELYESLEWEFYTTSLRLPGELRTLAYHQHRLLDLPGVERREVRLYTNGFMDLLEDLSQGKSGPAPGAPAFRWSDWLTARQGLLVLPRYGRLQSLLHWRRQCQAALHLWVNLRADGRRVRELTEYSWLDGLDRNKIWLERPGGQLELHLRLTAAEKELQRFDQPWPIESGEFVLRAKR